VPPPTIKQSNNQADPTNSDKQTATITQPNHHNEAERETDAAVNQSVIIIDAVEDAIETAIPAPTESDNDSNNNSDSDNNSDHKQKNKHKNNNKMVARNKTTQLLEEASQKYEQAKALHEQENFEGAVALLEEALKTNETVLGKYHKVTIKTYWRIGRSKIHLKDNVPAALVAFKRAIRTCELSYGKDHTATKTLREDVAGCLEGVPRMDDVGTNSSHSSFDETPGSKPNSRSSMSISNGSIKVDFSNQSYMEIIDQWLQYEQEGDQLCNRRKLPAAIKVYREALSMEDKVFGGISNMDCADIMCKLACLYREQNDLNNSEELYRKALSMFEATLGQDHPATRGAASNLKHLRKEEGNIKAKSWWGKTTSSFRRKQMNVNS